MLDLIIASHVLALPLHNSSPVTSNYNVVCCLLQVEGLEVTELAPKKEELERVSVKENDGSSSLKKQEPAIEAKDARHESGLKRTKEEGNSRRSERPRKILKSSRHLLVLRRLPNMLCRLCLKDLDIAFHSLHHDSLPRKAMVDHLLLDPFLDV
jgi:hypothetical protein